MFATLLGAVVFLLMMAGLFVPLEAFAPARAQPATKQAMAWGAGLFVANTMLMQLLGAPVLEWLGAGRATRSVAMFALVFVGSDLVGYWVHRAMHRVDHALILLRAGDRQHLRKPVGDLLRLVTHAAGDDDLAVLVQRGADRGERFLLGAVEEAAGVDDDEIGSGMLAGELIAFRAQPRDDALAVDQRFRAAERDEAHLRRNLFVHRDILKSGST